jgi:flagellar biosynthetic protein FliR
VVIPIASAWAFALVLFRTSGLVLGMPVFGARTVPARVKLALAVVVAWAAWAGAGSPAVAPPETLWALTSAGTRETVFGLLSGLAARMTLQAALAVGQLASLSTGIGFGNLVNPASGAESNAGGEMLFLVAEATALAFGIHREAIAWMARSVRLFPPGAPAGFAELAQRVIVEATGAAALAVRLAFPVLAAVLVGHIASAVASRMAPQLSLQHIGFSVAIIAGGGAFYLVAPTVAESIARSALAALPR